MSRTAEQVFPYVDLGKVETPLLPYEQRNYLRQPVNIQEPAEFPLVHVPGLGSSEGSNIRYINGVQSRLQRIFDTDLGRKVKGQDIRGALLQYPGFVSGWIGMREAGDQEDASRCLTDIEAIAGHPAFSWGMLSIAKLNMRGLSPQAAEAVIYSVMRCALDTRDGVRLKSTFAEGKPHDLRFPSDPPVSPDLQRMPYAVPYFTSIGRVSCPIQRLVTPINMARMITPHGVEPTWDEAERLLDHPNNRGVSEMLDVMQRM
jgi:hypothetical protein